MKRRLLLAPAMAIVRRPGCTPSAPEPSRATSAHPGHYGARPCALRAAAEGPAGARGPAGRAAEREGGHGRRAAGDGDGVFDSVRGPAAELPRRRPASFQSARCRYVFAERAPNRLLVQRRELYAATAGRSYSWSQLRARGRLATVELQVLKGLSAGAGRAEVAACPTSQPAKLSPVLASPQAPAR